MNQVEKSKRLKELDPLAVEITQNKGTEPAFTGKYVNEHSDGSYHCVVCGQKLFEAETKFESNSGWPSFDQSAPNSVELVEDNSHGMHRTEVVCSNCGAHLGHMFEDGPKQTTGQRFCINSCALDLNKNSTAK